MDSEKFNIFLISGSARNLCHSKPLIEMSKVISDMVKDLEVSNDCEVYLPFEVPVETLQKLNKFCELNNVIDMPATSKNLVKSLSARELYDMAIISNFLDIKGLLQLVCNQIASTLCGKTLDEMRAMFGVMSDLTRKDKIQIMNDLKWYESEELDGLKVEEENNKCADKEYEVIQETFRVDKINIDKSNTEEITLELEQLTVNEPKMDEITPEEMKVWEMID